MSAKHWKALLAGSAAVVGAAAFVSAEAVAQTAEPQQVAQVTSVSQLSDVAPTDWAFQALQSLVERYGCIAGYPDGTYRGNAATSRYEFAAGLNACLDRINELIAAGLADKVSREDLATVQRLQEEFAAELEAIRGRVDALEAKVAELEANPLGLNAATSKLGFEIVTGLFAASEPDSVDDAGEDNNIYAPYRVRMNFDASFTGEDRFRVRLQGREAPSFNGDPVGFGFAGGSGAGSAVNDDVNLDDVYYLTPFTVFGTEVDLYLGLNSTAPSDIFVYGVPFDALSDWADANDPTHDVTGDATAGFSWDINDLFTISYGYGAAENESPSEGSGVFAGESVHAVELAFTPADSLLLTVGYSNTAGGQLTDGTADFQAISANVAWEITERIIFAGWYAHAFFEEDDFDSTNSWLVGFAFPDLFIDGANGGILGGSPDFFVNAGTEDGDSPFQIEAYYSFPLTDNINITPGIYYISNSDGDDDDIVVGGVRTTFSF